MTYVGRDSLVITETRYELKGPGIESRWERDSPPPVQTGAGDHTNSCVMDTWSVSPGVKRPGRCFNHPPPSSAELKERVEL